MKQLTTLIILSLLVIASSFIHKHNTPWRVTDIKDARKKQLPEPDLIHHKYHDVEVYRIMDDGDYYTVYFYSNFNDSLFRYEASRAPNDEFDKAAYKWLNDTLVSIRLYSSQTKKEVNFKVWGTGHGQIKTTGMIADN